MSLESTFPKLADKITSARDNGFSEQQIESFLRERIETAKYNGYTDEQIASYVGFSPKQEEKEHLKVIGKAYSLPPSAIKDTMIVARGTGMNPHILLEDRNLYGEVAGRGEEKKKVEVPQTLSDFARRTVTSDQEPPEGVNPMEWKHMVGYSAALPFSRIIERPAWALTGLGFSLLDEGAELLNIDHSKAGKWFDQMAKYYNNPDANAPVSSYVSGVRSSRREAYYDRGFAWGIANDIADATTDLGYLIMTMKGLTGVNTVKEQAGLLPKMLSQMDRIKGTAKLHGLHAFLTTPGTMQDRFEAGLYRIAYNLTPYVAQAPGLGNLTGGRAIITDVLLNTMLSSGQYKKMFDDAGGVNKEFVAQALPNLVMDVVMSLSTTGSKEALDAEAKEAWQEKRNRVIARIAQLTGRAEADVRQSFDDIDRAREEAAKKDWTPQKENVSRETSEVVDKDDVSRETLAEKLGSDILSKTVEEVALSREEATESLADSIEKTADDDKAPREDLQGMTTSNLKSYERSIAKQLKEQEDALFGLREEGVAKEDLTAEYEELGSLFGEMLAIRDEMSGRTVRKDKRAKQPEKMPEATWELYTREFLKDPQKGTGRERLVTETDALKAAFRKAAQASRKAFSAGKGEGVAKERARQKELRDKQRQKKQARKILKRMVNDIVKAPNNNLVHADEVGEINTLLEDYHLKMLREDKADIKQEMDMASQSLVDGKGEPRVDVDIETFLSSISPKDRAMLGKKTLNDMTVLEFAELHERVMELKEQGRMKLEVKRAREAQEIDDLAHRLMAEVGARSKKDKADPIFLNPKDKERDVNAAEVWLKAYSYRPARLMDMLDGHRDYKGIFYRTVIEATDRLYNKYMRFVALRTERMDEVFERFGMRIEELNEVAYSSPEFARPVTFDQAMLMWALWQNDKGQGSLKAMGITDEIAGKVFSRLDDRHKALVQRAFADAEEQWQRFSDAYVDMFNIRPEREKNYLRIYRVGKTDSLFDSLAKEASGRGLTKAYANKGSGIGRVASFDGLPPVNLDLGFYETWHRSVTEHETLINLGKHVRDLHNLFGKEGVEDNIPALGETIKQVYGAPYLRAIQSYINRVADPNFYKSYDDVAKAKKFIMENSAVAYLGFNLLTMAKQVPSMMLYLTEVGPVDFIRTTTEAITNYDSMRDMAFRLDPEMKNRALDRSIEWLRNSRDPEDRSTYKKIVRKVGEKGLYGIAALDRVVTVIGWNAVFRQAMQNGMDVESAALRAKRITLNTQPAAQAKELASIYSQNDLLNVALLFSNQLNNIYNLAVHDVWGNMKNGQVRKAVVTALALSMNAWAMQAIMTGEVIPDDPKKWFTGMAANSISATPIIGKYIGGALQGYRSGSEFVDKVFGDSTRVLKDVVSMEADWDTAMRAFQVFALTQRMPYTGIKRVLDMDGPLDVKTLFGIRPTKNKTKRRIF